MAKARLPFASYSGADPEFSIADEGWERLETAYGRPLHQAAREWLIGIGRAYLANRRSEKVWQSYHDVEALLPPFEKAASALWDIAFGGPTHSDASSELETILDQALANEPLRIRPDRGHLLFLTNEWLDFGQQFQLPEGAYAIKFDLGLIREIAMHYRVALTRAAQEIGRRANEAGMPSKTATEHLILALVEWAKAFGLVHGPYIDGTDPAPFSCFVCSFLAEVPQEWREKDVTTGSVAAQVRRLKREDASHKREQMRRATKA